jgi:hypothetical protein
VKAPHRSSAGDIQGLLTAGWSERDVVDLALAAATTAFLDRVETGLRECDLQPDAPIR